MAKIFLTSGLVLLLAGLALATQNPTPTTTHVMVRMELDNNEKEVNASLAKLTKNIATELCNVPQQDVQILRVMKDDTKVLGVGDTQTLVYAACKAPTNKLEAVLDDCQDWMNQHQVKDETKDKTSWWNGGEVEVDDIACKYVENGNFEYFSKADANRAATPGTTAGNLTIAAPSTSTTSKAAGVVASAAVVGAAVVGTAVLLMA